MVHARLEAQPTGVEVLEPDQRIDVQARDRIWLGWHSTLYLYDAKARAVQKRFSPTACRRVKTADRTGRCGNAVVRFEASGMKRSAPSKKKQNPAPPESTT